MFATLTIRLFISCSAHLDMGLKADVATEAPTVPSKDPPQRPFAGSAGRPKFALANSLKGVRPPTEGGQVKWRQHAHSQPNPKNRVSDTTLPGERSQQK
jgi:hypothetical protein